MRPVLLVVFLSACGQVVPPAGVCESRCGLSLSAFGPNCGDFQKREDETLAALERRAGADYARPFSCTQLAGYQVRVEPSSQDGRWYETGIQTWVTGLTRCDQHFIWLGDLSWSTNALPHEMVHAIEACADPQHTHWAEKGIYRALADLGTD